MSESSPLSLEQEIRVLLADSRHDGHPLRVALATLWERYAGLAGRLDRVTRISDVYQSVMLERETDLEAQLDLHLRRLAKVSRISDRYQMMMRDLNVALIQASTHDILTGLPNRRLLIDRLKDETARTRRSSAPFSVAMLDLDGFKSINDTHGHDAGDTVLASVAHMLASQLRQTDMCGRWGGEEFLLLLPGTDLNAAQEVLERLRNEMNQTRIPVGETAMLSITFSAGISVFNVADEDYAAVVYRADQALMRAKRSGRNCWETEA